MNRAVNPAFLIALAVLAALPIGGCCESSPSEVPPGRFVGRTLSQVGTPHGAMVMAGFGEAISAIMGEAWEIIGRLRASLKAKDRGDEGERLRGPGDGQSSDLQEHLDQRLAGVEEEIQGRSSLQVLLHSEKLGVSYRGGVQG